MIDTYDDGEEGEIVRHISITNTQRIYLGREDGENEQQVTVTITRVMVEPDDSIWDAIEHAFDIGMQ